MDTKKLTTTSTSQLLDEFNTTSHISCHSYLMKLSSRLEHPRPSPLANRIYVTTTKSSKKYWPLCRWPFLTTIGLVKQASQTWKQPFKWPRSWQESAKMSSKWQNRVNSRRFTNSTMLRSRMLFHTLMESERRSATLSSTPKPKKTRSTMKSCEITQSWSWPSTTPRIMMCNRSLQEKRSAQSTTSQHLTNWRPSKKTRLLSETIMSNSMPCLRCMLEP